MRLWEKEPLAPAGISPRGELIVQLSHSDSNVTSSRWQLTKDPVVLRNQLIVHGEDLRGPRTSIDFPRNCLRSLIFRHSAALFFIGILVLSTLSTQKNPSLLLLLSPTCYTCNQRSESLRKSGKSSIINWDWGRRTFWRGLLKSRSHKLSHWMLQPNKPTRT